MISEVNIRETVKAALKAAGWSDDTINAFLYPDIAVVNPVSTSTYIPNAFPDEVDTINLPLMDSTSLTITQLADADAGKKLLRQDAIKSLEKLRSFHSGSYAKAIDVAIEAMELEVVMCKDCRFRRGEKKDFCYGIEKYTKDDDFCSRGEMIEDETG